MTEKIRTVTLPLTEESAAMYERVEAEFKRRSPYAKTDGPSVLRFALHTALEQIDKAEES